MKHKVRLPEEEAVMMHLAPDPSLQDKIGCCSCSSSSRADQLVQSPNVFPFRRKFKPSQFLTFNVGTFVLLSFLTNLISAQVVDRGYGRTTSTMHPNQSLQGAGSGYYNSNQQIRDLRDFPDSQRDVNWLSPNPFADRDKQNNPISSSYDDVNRKNDYLNNPNRNRIEQQFQNPNVRLPGYIVEDLPAEHRGDLGNNPGDPNYRPPQGPPSGGFGEEQYDGFGRNLPVDNRDRDRGGVPGSPIPPYSSRERGSSLNTDWNSQQRQFAQNYFNASRSGSMNLSPGTNPLGPGSGGGLQGPPGQSNSQYGPNLPPVDSSGRNFPAGVSPWNNLPGYPSVGPSSNLPGTSGNHYYPNGTRMPGTGNYQGNLNYPSSYPGMNNNYPGSNSDNPYYPGTNTQDQRHRPYDSTSTWKNKNPYYPNPGGDRPTGGSSSYDSSRYNNRYPVGPVNYPGRVTFNPGDPHVNIWNEQWSTTTYRPTAPGVLGRWRPDLQGQQRPEDINQVPQAVYVTTNYGRIQGYKVKIYDGPWVPLPARPGIANVDKMKSVVSSFMGIPYARAPINEGRFRPPRSHPGWQLHQAVEFGPACPQPARFFGFSQGIVQVDEDCLYLNVHSPDVGSGVEGAPFPVLFYIHDGDFIHGASNQFPPHQLVAWYKLVVVTVNFRLGALGFLSTADEYSPGNYGMLDLAMALKWVHENIRSFNGDPERITVVGLGSGAAAAGLLMVAPRTRAYVKNVVAMEGAPTADWAAIIDRYRAQNTTQLYSFKMGCWQDFETTSWKMVQCLRSRSWQELANLELDPDVGTFPWAPVVDRTFKTPKDDYLHDWKEEDWRFLPDSPYNLLRHGDYQFVKYMTGFSRQSAADLLYNNKTLAPNYIVTREWFDEQIHLWVKKYNYTLNPEGVFSAIRYAYTYWPDPFNVTHLREEYINFLSDALYRSPVDQSVKLLLARGIPVHTYLLNYTLEGLRLPFWREVPRGMEYYLLSGAPFMDPEFYPERLRVERSAWTEGDRNMSSFFMTAVANMAHYGQPTPREVLGLHWEQSLPSDLKYLSLNQTNNSTMQRNYRQREVTFWTEYMPFVVGREVPTYPPTTEYWWEPNEPMQIAFWTVSGVCLILVVALVACCLLWRTAKKQRDRIYDDLGLGSEPLGLGTIVGDEISDYAETVKTGDSMDSGVKLTSRHPDGGDGGRRGIQSIYSPHPGIHHNGHGQQGGGGGGREPPETTSGPVMGSYRGDRFPTPMKRAVRDREREGRDTPQTQV